jgi:hypothetical protein
VAHDVSKESSGRSVPFQAMKAERGIQVWLYSFFNLSIRQGWVVKATKVALAKAKRTGTHFIGG